MWIMDRNNKANIVSFRGPRKKTKKWPPGMKFSEFGKVRIPKLLRAMKSVKNLATVYNPDTKIGYEYTNLQRDKLLREIRKGWRELTHAWANSETVEDRKNGKNAKKNNKPNYESKDSGWSWDPE